MERRDQSSSINQVEPKMSKKIEANEVATDVTNEVVTPMTYNDLVTKYKTKSGVIRGLHAEGKDCKSIFKILKDLNVTNNEGTHPIRYQHVRNVLNTPIKKVG